MKIDANLTSLLLTAGVQLLQSGIRDLELHAEGALTDEQLVDKWTGVVERVRQADAAFEAAAQSPAAKQAEQPE